MSKRIAEAPGHPGTEPHWAAAGKSGVGTAVASPEGAASLVWFTLGQGIFNEIFYPRPDLPCTRDFGLIVTDGKDFFSEEKLHTHHETAYLADGVPAYRLTNTCENGRYRIEKVIYTHSRHHVVIQHTRFVPLQGNLQGLSLVRAARAPTWADKGAITAPGSALERRADALRPAAGICLGPGVLGQVAQHVGGIRGRLRWLAGAAPPQTVDGNV